VAVEYASPPPVKPLFWYAGGKRLAAAYVWRALGNPRTYVEPFAGSAAVLMGRPVSHFDGERRIEVVNDANGRLVNLYRAIAADPEAVWRAAQGPRALLDLNARHKALTAALPALTERLTADPRWCDPEMAGWQLYTLRYAAHPQAAMDEGRAVIGRPAINPSPVTPGQIADVAARLTCSRLLILCGDWTKTVTPKLTENGPVGVFLDPPYLSAQRQDGLYAAAATPGDGRAAAAACRQWAIEAAARPGWRIVLAGYADEGRPDGWTEVAWSSAAGGDSRHAERLWLSPGCRVAAFDPQHTLLLNPQRRGPADDRHPAPHAGQRRRHTRTRRRQGARPPRLRRAAHRAGLRPHAQQPAAVRLPTRRTHRRDDRRAVRHPARATRPALVQPRPGQRNQTATPRRHRNPCPPHRIRPHRLNDRRRD
jgi:hypothetical protein